VGDPNACLEPNESCQVEENGSACSCKPGFWVGKNQVISAKSAKVFFSNAFFIVPLHETNTIYKFFL
jgi:hypothetical protein